MIYPGEGLVSHGYIDPGLLVYDASVMGKILKTGFSVVCAYSAFADTAKGHFRSGKMDDRVVDAAASELAMFEDSFLCRAVFAEEIKRQRVRMTVDCGDGFGKLGGAKCTYRSLM